ncbi:MAG: hypothetical protein RIR18_1867 [Pseudomonadota bacterium]|jgi:phospholipid-binding lipoprotein MlaA
MNLRITLFVGITVLLGACTAVPQPSANDPYESFNRSMYRVHQAMDVVVKPVAQAYDDHMPLPARAGLGNAFGNAGDLWISANNLMQAKPADAGTDLARFVINSTLGIFGLFDVASELGYQKHDEDLGQTLATWGVGSGGYLFFPIAGPRTVRDGAAWIVDLQADPLVSNTTDIAVRNSLIGLKVVHTRAMLLPTDAILEDATDDPYTYIREAYLQHRKYLIHDGDMPSELENSLKQQEE